MKRFRKLCLMLMVWATAVSTVLGGIPRSVCRCPETAPSQTAAETNLADKASCCCGHTAKAPKSSNQQQGNGSQEDAPANPCCGNTIEQHSSEQPQITKVPSVAPGSEPQVDSGGCQKETVNTPLQSYVDPSKRTDHQVLTAALDVVHDQLIALPQSSGIDCNLAVCQPRPPTDLITTLQRLTI